MDKDRARELDQFYTKPEVASRFVDTIQKFISFSDLKRIVEPCVGTGAIFNLLPEDKRLGFDIDPKIEVPTQDFLTSDLSYLPNTLVITNPPYGTNSTLAVKFFKKAAQFSDHIAFLVPIQWQRYSLQNRLPKDFNLVFTEKIDSNSFIFEGEDYGVNTCIQLWSRKLNLPDIRIREKPITSHPDFEFVKNTEDADFLLIVCGRRSQYIHEVDSRVSRYTVERIKVNREGVREIFESVDWDRFGKESTGTMWINRQMIVEEYSKKLEKS